MNERERFQAVMHYQPRDRGIIADFGFWDETLPVWHAQGLPAWVNAGNSDAFFGMDRYERGIGVNVDLCPVFDYRVLEDRGDHEVVQQTDGVRVLRKKFMGSIPQHQGHLLVDRDSWRRHYKPRLDPDRRERLPVGWESLVMAWRQPGRPTVLTLYAGSLYGKLRDWMGLEALSYAIYDDPAWFEEMVTTLADCAIGALTRVLESGVQFDACGMWEDMCYRAGPLISPRHFKQFLSPHYRRIADLVRSYGVDVVWVDSDGCIDRLVPLWLECGVNCMFPVEVGVWGADPMRYRKEFGRDLLMLGGFDKHILAGPKAGIEAEVRRLQPLVEEGGFIGFCDHRVPPDVPLDHYMYYLATARRLWSKDLPSLKQMGTLAASLPEPC
ncbi:MAG: hypothetical protein IT323_11160 [Anaerolineae bacterium]|nr:hypothetical protein [Anaerolineae bacterium]